MSSAPQKRFIANGRSRLTVRALILSPIAASRVLKVFVCTWQTGVSSDGTTLMIVGLPATSALVMCCIPLGPKQVRSNAGAAEPTLISSPARVSGLPLNVTAP